MTPEQLTAWREACGGRRFFLTAGAGVVNTLLLVWGKIDQSTFANLIMATVAVYIGAAATVQVKQIKGAKPDV